MRTTSPWWVSVALGVGLLFVFVGERLFGHDASIRGVVSMLGIVLVVAVTLIRAWTMTSSKGARRKVERTLLLCHIGTLVALVLYLLTTSWGQKQLHMSETTAVHFTGALTVVWVVLLIASIVPVLMIEISLGTALRERFDLHAPAEDDVGTEYYRVREIGWSGLSIALGVALLMVTCNVASQRNVQKDLSYFKTSAPGDSTVAITQSSQEPLRALLFFPDANEVKEQVKDYFESLASKSGGKISVESHDRFFDAELAGKYKVTKDGVIVIVRGTGDKEKSQTIEVDTEIEKARKGASKLRTFDREVNTILMKLVREKRKAYVMTGHGEINDPESIPSDLKGRVPERRTTMLKKRLGELNYEVKDLGLIDLAKDVPDDATLVVMLAPSIPLQGAEFDALGRYLDKGGRLLIALDPKSEPGLGSLEGKLGIRYNPGDLTDDQAFLPQRGTPADRRFVITTQFSAHASTTALSRSVDKGIVLIDSGALEDAPLAKGAAAPTKTITIRSMESSFLDLNGNFAFDASSEKRQRWNLAAAIEGPKIKDGSGKDKDGWRTLVFADADLFADALVSNQMGRASVILVGGPILEDAVHWLGGEEVFAGEVVSEEDKPIQHTKDQDARWFLMTIVGAPLIVLTLGIVGTRRRRKVSDNKREVKP